VMECRIEEPMNLKVDPVASPCLLIYKFKRILMAVFAD